MVRDSALGVVQKWREAQYQAVEFDPYPFPGNRFTPNAVAFHATV